MTTISVPSATTELQAVDWGFRAGMCVAAALVLNTDGSFKSAVEILSEAGVDLQMIKTVGLAPEKAQLLEQALLAVA